MVSDTTPFFVGNKAVTWFSKVDGVPEHFNNAGFHTVTGKALKPITKYMIDKYVEKKIAVSGIEIFWIFIIKK